MNDDAAFESRTMWVEKGETMMMMVKGVWLLIK
jgi:hypothetical protein